MKAEIYRTEQSRDILMEFCDGALQYWSYPHERTMLNTKYGQTHVITAGSKEKPALVLLAPGGIAPARTGTILKTAGVRMKKLLPGADIRIDANGKHGITQYGGGIAAFLAAE